MPWTTPGTAVAGNVLTASFWNEQVRDNMSELAPFFSDWTDYTPTLTQGVGITISKAFARYMRVGEMVWAQGRISASSGGSANQNITLSLPVNAARGGNAFSATGVAVFVDNSPADNYTLVAHLEATELRFLSEAGAQNYFGIGPAVTIASGDVLSWSVCYERA